MTGQYPGLLGGFTDFPGTYKNENATNISSQYYLGMTSSGNGIDFFKHMDTFALETSMSIF